MTPDDQPAYYQTIDREGTAEFNERSSRFIGYTFPLTDLAEFKQRLAGVKKEHSRATHHCFAYRLGLDGSIWRASDDGEPSGSAGKPILGQIDSRQMTNAGVIVVRYFGGIMLGVPGLINAYRTAASLALQVTPLVQRPVLVNHRLEFDYTQMNEIMRVLKQFDCSIIKQENHLFSLLETGIPKNRLEEVLFKFRVMRDVTVSAI